MDMNTITTLIGSLGFPIVMCLMMYSQMNKQDERHREEMTKVVDSLNNNTMAITQLTLKLESKEVI